MLARELLQLLNLRRVAGEARIGNITAENDLFWLVRVLVALEAAAKLVVWLAFVALAAERDDFPVCRRVAVMAVLAGNLGLVCPSFGLDVGRCLGVALDAVSAGQGDSRFCRSCSWLCRFGCHCCGGKQKHEG